MMNGSTYRHTRFLLPVMALCAVMSLLTPQNTAAQGCEIDQSAILLGTNLVNCISIGPNVKMLYDDADLATPRYAAGVTSIGNEMNTARFNVGENSKIFYMRFGDVRGGNQQLGRNSLALWSYFDNTSLGDHGRIDRRATLSGDERTIAGGNNVTIGRNTRIEGPFGTGNNVTIGDAVRIDQSNRYGSNVFVGDGGELGTGSEFGNHVYVGENLNSAFALSLGAGVVIGNDFSAARQRIGDYTYLLDNVTLGGRNSSTGQDNSLVGSNVMLMENSTVGQDVSLGNNTLIGRNVNIGDNATIGEGSIVVYDATVGDNATIPANSYVYSDGSYTPLGGWSSSDCASHAGAVVIDSDMDCENRVGENSKVVMSTVGWGSDIGPDSTIVESELGNATFGARSHVERATVGQLELPATFGIGAVVRQGARVVAAEVGDHARIGRNARIRGGRGLDFIRIGNDLTLGNDALVRIRQLGNNAVIGNGAQIGESTSAGDNFYIGDNSRWVIGGDVGDNVSIGRNAIVNGGLSAGNGVTLWHYTEIGYSNRFGNDVMVDAGTVTGNGVQLGNNTWIMYNTDIGDNVTTGENVVVGYLVNIGEGATIGANSIVSAGATVPPGASIPPRSLVDANGQVSPL